MVISGWRKERLRIAATSRCERTGREFMEREVRGGELMGVEVE